MIYCIGNREHKLCKIGFTNDVEKRIVNLQVAAPFALTCFDYAGGNKKQEAELHLMFLKYRVRGEWFTLSQEIANYFGFELAPPLKMWAVYLAYVHKVVAMGGQVLKVQSSQVICVMAGDEKEAVATAKAKNNILGYYLDAKAGIVPEDDMRRALSVPPDSVAQSL